MTALVYLNIAATIKGFGAATALNGFIFVLFLIAGEADTSYIIGTIVLSVPAIHVAILALRWAEKVLEKQTAELK